MRRATTLSVLLATIMLQLPMVVCVTDHGHSPFNVLIASSHECDTAPATSKPSSHACETCTPDVQIVEMQDHESDEHHNGDHYLVKADGAVYAGASLLGAPEHEVAFTLPLFANAIAASSLTVFEYEDGWGPPAAGDPLVRFDRLQV